VRATPTRPFRVFSPIGAKPFTAGNLMFKHEHQIRRADPSWRGANLWGAQTSWRETFAGALVIRDSGIAAISGEYGE